MKIDEKDLDGQASNIVTKCMATRHERVAPYHSLKHYYLFGAQEGNQSPYGKIHPHIQLLNSYLYSQGTVEFDLSVTNQPDEVYEKAELIEKRLNTTFLVSKTAQKFNEALNWALVFNSMFLKFDWRRGKLKPYIIEPHNMGVINESVQELNDQEAFCHSYTISKDELARRVSGLTNGADIMRRVTATPVQREDAFPESINRLIVAGNANFTSTTTRGMINIPELFNQLQYKPKTVEDVVEMYEIWAWDDDKDDYRTITVAAPGVVIYGRKDIGNLLGIKGRHPFVHVCPNRMYDYFWGWSEVTGLIKLQDWMTQRLREIRHILEMQANPPRVFSGFGGISDEKFAAMSSPNAWLSEPTPNAKAEVLAPDLPNDFWQELIMMQEMFNDISGLSDVLQGKGESGVRAKSHADTLARLGSGRIKQRAQDIEQTLEEAGGLIIDMMRKKDPHRYTLSEKHKMMPFTAAQFTDDYSVRVDAHSASPVFSDDYKNLAFMLAKFGAIGPEGLLQLAKPPKLDYLLQQAKEAAKKKEIEQQQMMAQGMDPNKTIKKVA